MSKAFGKLGCLLIMSVLFVSFALGASTLPKDRCPNLGSANGQCVKVANHYLYITKSGASGPRVVFESGRGDSSDSWRLVRPIVSKFSQTIAYDRSGLGRSQASSQSATGTVIAHNLKLLLQKAGVKPPYILVGHSDGGLYVQMFARLYPKLTAAVVLVDSASQDQTFTGALPKKTSRVYKEAIGFETTRRQLKVAPPFPPVPLIVLTAAWHGSRDPSYRFHLVCNGRPCTMVEGKNEVAWIKLQNRLARLSPKSSHLFAYDSGHYIQKYQPLLVIDAVYTVIQQLGVKKLSSY